MGTYDEPRYEKTHIFVNVLMGQWAGSKEMNSTYNYKHKPSRTCILTTYVK